MVDANNGYNLNLTRRVLAETAEDHVYWIEEPFHEDATLYRHLKRWMAREGLATLIADGEGAASPRLLDWAREGLIDVVQVDVLHPGFSRWLEVGPLLDRWDARSAPHHYGEPFGNYAAGHLAPAIRRFEGVEWDDATVPGLDASAYAIDDGHVLLPDQPGFGLHLDEDRYIRMVTEGGYTVNV
jgi:L-alanine-DL-glutamate epimerase-like enolase superfamily enzyme